LLVPPDLSLARLHDVIQIAFGWQNSHLHEFRVGRQRYGSPDPEDFGFGGPTIISEKKARVEDVLGWKGAKAVYTYDFGDSWDHGITVEKVLPRDTALRYPLCIAGKLHGPPEDCGGLPGFYNLLEAMGDPNHPDHEEMSEWVDDGFDPLAFSADEVNAELGWLQRPRR